METITEVKERPILFSAPMVRAILEGRKTVTRRVVKPQPDDDGLWNDTDLPRSLESTLKGWNGTVDETGESKEFRCPYDADVLWVRETFGNGYNAALDSNIGKEEKDFTLRYWVFKDGSQKYSDGSYFPNNKRGDEDSFKLVKWKPSIHMPRAACRLRLEIQSIRVERLHDITEEEAKKEGAPMYVPGHGVVTNADIQADPCYVNFVNYRMGFEHLWTSINGAESWEANPFCWVIHFKKIQL